MSVKMTKKEYDVWHKKHMGTSQYEIFHKKNGEILVDFTFWAKSRTAALEELELFKQKQQLISPSDFVEYFYRQVNNYIVVNDDGSYTLYSEMSDMLDMDKKETVLEKIKSFFWICACKVKNIKYMISDMMFWLRHYDANSRHGEEQTEYWDICSTITRKLRFNVPRLIKFMHGYPQIYADKASSQNSGGGKKTEEIAMDLWKSELEKLLLYIKLYDYYNGSGIFDDNDPEMKKIDEEYRHTLPLQPGTCNEIDYVKCEELAQKYWELYCDHWKKIGQMCWD